MHIIFVGVKSVSPIFIIYYSSPSKITLFVRVPIFSIVASIKSKGGKTIAESEETSVLYGMPKVAAETGAADLIIPNYKIVEKMINFVN
ncbi:unnamed protein product [marine sediment metagenome]|uniref:CheB-type methylesterase domain-containing protein n=1 Tax=marine sediment metagenome TaxID=412755 RepID=X1B4R0_9ZZZZ